MVRLFVRPVRVDTTRLVVAKLVVSVQSCCALVPVVDRLAVLEHEKRLLVLLQLIVYVPKTFALVPTVPLLLEALVPQTVPTFVRPVLVDTTKLVPLALDVNLAERAPEKPRLVLRHRIVYVPKIRAVVRTVSKQQVPLVLQTIPTFVRLVLVDSTKLPMHVLHVVLHVELALV